MVYTILRCGMHVLYSLTPKQAGTALFAGIINQRHPVALLVHRVTRSRVAWWHLPKLLLNQLDLDDPWCWAPFLIFYLASFVEHKESTVLFKRTQLTSNPNA